MSQTREDRMYRYFRSLRRSPKYHGFRHDHYAKGWCAGPYMQVAMQFGVPIREVKDVIESRKSGRAS